MRQRLIHIIIRRTTTPKTTTTTTTTMKILDRFRSFDNRRAVAQTKKKNYDQLRHEKKPASKKQHDGDLVLDVNGGKVKVCLFFEYPKIG